VSVWEWGADMRFRKFMVFSAIAIAAAMTAGFCNVASAADDREICKTASGDAAIAACTQAIDSKKCAKKKFKRTLSLLYTNRGVEYEIKKEFDKAIADHDQAIKVDPKNWAAYNNRGNAYAGKGDYDHAIADYDTAVKLNPKYAEAFYNRGLAKRKKGDATAADADIAQAKELQPGIASTGH
jgi:tetratricopeptide (TPR) repeat protein